MRHPPELRRGVHACEGGCHTSRGLRTGRAHACSSRGLEGWDSLLQSFVVAQLVRNRLPILVIISVNISGS